MLVQTAGGGAPLRRRVPQTALNITPMFAPDGTASAYAHSDEKGTDIFVANVGRSLRVATLDRGALRGQLVTNIFTRRTSHRIRLDSGRPAAALRDGG